MANDNTLKRPMPIFAEIKSMKDVRSPYAFEQPTVRTDTALIDRARIRYEKTPGRYWDDLSGEIQTRLVDAIEREQERIAYRVARGG